MKQILHFTLLTVSDSSAALCCTHLSVHRVSTYEMTKACESLLSPLIADGKLALVLMSGLFEYAAKLTVHVTSGTLYSACAGIFFNFLNIFFSTCDL